MTGIQTRLPEPDLLRYAASAFRHLADDRATALIAACQSRGVHLLDLPPVDFRQGVTVVHGRWRIRVREDVPGAQPMPRLQGAASEAGPLIVEIDGTPVGLIEFGRSSRPEAAAALQRIRNRAPYRSPWFRTAPRPTSAGSLAPGCGPLQGRLLARGYGSSSSAPAATADCVRPSSATADAGRRRRPRLMSPSPS